MLTFNLSPPNATAPVYCLHPLVHLQKESSSLVNKPLRTSYITWFQDSCSPTGERVSSAAVRCYSTESPPKHFPPTGILSTFSRGGITNLATTHVAEFLHGVSFGRPTNAQLQSRFHQFSWFQTPRHLTTEIQSYSRISWRIVNISSGGIAKRYDDHVSSRTPFDLDLRCLGLLPDRWASTVIVFILCKNGVNFHSIFHSLGIDLSDHFFWTEYRVNRTRFHSIK